MPYGQNPSAGKVNPFNGAVRPSDEELFSSEEEFLELLQAYGMSEDGTRLARGLGLI